MRRLIGKVVAGLAVIAGVMSLWRGEAETPGAPAPASPPPLRSIDLTLGRQGTLAATLGRQGVAPAEAAAISAALRDVVDLRRIRPGERLRLAQADDGAIVGVTYWRGAAERYEADRTRDGWTARAVSVPIRTEVAAIAGRLERSLFESLDSLGEGAVLVTKLVSLFEWDFDFAADCVPGDTFRMLVEKRFVDDVFVGYGEVLIAEYQSAGRPPLTAVAFPDGRGRARHYDADGRSIRKTFLRAPLDFTRVTSGFSHARKHPILGGVRPHLAVDYAAPLGTPVRVVADGVVEQAGWRGGNGLSIVVRHARGYRTTYNHLSRILARRGQRVRQREIIGRVGSTGLSTGAHLDYRVSKNGVFVDPLGETFLPGEPVPLARRRAFDSHLEGLLHRLDQATMLDRP